jgi:hypothetical protein
MLEKSFPEEEDAYETVYVPTGADEVWYGVVTVDETGPFNDRWNPPICA